MTEAAQVYMYTTAWCGYCAAARRLLANKGIAFDDISVDGKPDLRREMEEKSGGHTVPQIFINDKPVGGYDDIAELDKLGELDTLLGLN